MPLFEPLFRALNATGVRYVVVGGLATVMHGFARLTADADLIIDLSPAEARKFVGALVALGFIPMAPVPPLDFADPEIRAAWIRDKGMRVFTMIDRANPMRVVDLFVDHPIEFDQLHERSNSVRIESTPVKIASIPDLIRLKRLAGRPQDLSDIEALERIAARTKMAENPDHD